MQQLSMAFMVDIMDRCGLVYSKMYHAKRDKGDTGLSVYLIWGVVSQLRWPATRNT